jgi:DNA polymerase III sliding clamp (beta) subunit (PCNA family)
MELTQETRGKINAMTKAIKPSIASEEKIISFIKDAEGNIKITSGNEYSAGQYIISRNVSTQIDDFSLSELLNDLVSLLPSDERFFIRTTERQVEIVNEKGTKYYKFAKRNEDVQDFNLTKQEDENKQADFEAELKVGELLELLKGTIQDKEHLVQFYLVVRIEFLDDKITATSTDGFIFAQKEIERSVKGENGTVNIEKDAIRSIFLICEQIPKDEIIKITQKQNIIYFKNQYMWYLTRTIAGVKFPSIDGLIDSEPLREVKIKDFQSLKNALNVAKTFYETQGRKGSQKLTLDIFKDKIIVTARTDEEDENADKIESEVPIISEGQDCSINVSNIKLQRALSLIETEEARFIIQNKKPMVIRDCFLNSQGFILVQISA